MGATVTVNRKNLIAAVNRIAKSTWRKGKIECLRNIRIHLNGAVELAARNLDGFAIESVPHEHGEGESTIAVDGKQLQDAIRGLDCEELKLSATADALSVIGESASMMLQGQEFGDSGASRIEFQPGDEGSAVTVDAAAFKTALSAVLPMIDRESTRYALNGVRVELLEPERVRLIATDGRRAGVTVVGGCTIHPGEVVRAAAILPADCADQLLSLIGKSGVIHVEVGKNDTFRFTISANDYPQPAQFPRCGARQTVLTVQAVAGRFPNWEAAILNPEGERTRVTIEADALLTAIKTAAGSKMPKNDDDPDPRNIRFHYFYPERKISIKQGATGAASIRCNYPDCSPPDDVSLSAPYLRDAVDGFQSIEPTAKVFLLCRNGNGFVSICAANSAAGLGGYFVVMPLNNPADKPKKS